LLFHWVTLCSILWQAMFRFRCRRFNSTPKKPERVSLANPLDKVIESRRYYLFELPFLAAGFLGVIVALAFALAFLAERFLRFFFGAGVFIVASAGAAAAGFAAGFFATFLFCAANALVPARARAKTALIRILFIIVLRRFFLATDSMGL
jgi:hypothetical protein